MSAVLDHEIDALIDGASPQMVGGAYEGADRFNRELALWSPPMRSADLDLLPEKTIIDSRVRDLQRNDAYVSSGMQLHKDNIVGAAFLLNSKPANKTLGLDDTWAGEFQAEVEEKFTLYAESPQNWLDASRICTLTELVRLAVGVHVASGEVLASAEWLRESGRPFRTAVQMIDLDRLSNPYGQPDSPRLRRGVARNRWGAPEGYWVQVAHPTDYTVADNTYRWRYVPARKPWGRIQMVHIFEQQRPDQSRGVADLVAALKELRITKKFRDVTLQNAVVNATYAASIESELPSEAVFSAIGGGNMDEAIEKYGTAYLSAIAKYTGSARNMHIDGVKVPHLYPGTKLQLRPAGTPGGVGTDFEKSLLRYIAANLGVSYEQLSRDYTATNYSSARAAMNETWKYMQARKRFVADRFASTIFRLWLEEAMNRGEISSMPRNAPSWYEGLNAEAYSSCDWIGASRGQIDELKETQAAVLRLKYGLSTWEHELARFGKDWRKTYAQLERERNEREARGIELTEDNSINAASGAPREQEASDEPEDGSEDKTNA